MHEDSCRPRRCFWSLALMVPNQVPSKSLFSRPMPSDRDDVALSAAHGRNDAAQSRRPRCAQPASQPAQLSLLQEGDRAGVPLSPSLEADHAVASANLPPPPPMRRGRRAPLPAFLLALLLAVSFGPRGALGVCDIAGGDNSTECTALQTLRTAMTVSVWDSQMSLSTSYCTWTGVTCSGRRVAQLSLASRGLTGTIPAAIWSLALLNTLCAPSHCSLALADLQGALHTVLTMIVG